MKRTSFYAALLFFTLQTSLSNAQSPTEIPPADRYSNIDFSNIYNILFYIGLPILFLVGYLLWMRSKKKK